MINSINFIDGLDGLSSGVALIAAVTLGIISVTGPATEPAVGADLPHPGGGAPGVPPLELPPRVDLHRHERRHVPGLHPRPPLHPRQRQGRGRAPRAGRADHRHLLHHRSAALPGPLALLGGPRPHPPPPPGPGPLATRRPSCSSTRSAPASAPSRSSSRGAVSSTRSWARSWSSGWSSSCSTGRSRTGTWTRRCPARPDRATLAGLHGASVAVAKERAWRSRSARRAQGTRSWRSSAPRACGPGSRSSRRSWRPARPATWSSRAGASSTPST